MKTFIIILSMPAVGRACTMLCIGITLLTITLSTINPSFAQTADPPSGSGTSGDPYQVTSINNLFWITQNDASWDKHFVQTQDINAGDTKNWHTSGNNAIYGYTPIGNNITAFTGTYNGQNHSIDSLFRVGGIRVGFFGRVVGGKISNMGITNVYIRACEWKGALVGIIEAGEVNNCYSTGEIVGTILPNNSAHDYYTGGLIGHNYGSILTNSYSSCSVSGYEYVGGLVGLNHDYSQIINCYATGNVDGQRTVGGLVGWNWIYSVIRNCYSRGNVSKISSIFTSFGGFVGSCSSNSTNENCFSTGNVYLEGFTDRGFAGGAGAGICISNFFDNTASNQSTAYGATALTTVLMKTKSSFTDEGWDFSSVWAINGVDNDGYPFLQMLGIPIINTTAVFNIGPDTAQSGGNFIYEGNSPLIAKGVIWDVSNNPSLTNHLGINDEGGSPGDFISTLTGLLDTTIYYVRAYANNSAGTGYGATISFYTILSPPEIIIPPGNALDFDGINDYVSISNESHFDFYFKVTLEAWIKVGAFDKEWQAIITKGDGAWRLERYGTTNHLNFGTTGTIPMDLEGTTDVNDGQWHHIACVMTGIRKNLYVDGQLDATIPIIGDIDRTNDLLYFGENSGNTGRNFDGLIDEVRIWNIDRTAAEIQDNMNIALTGHENGLVAYYKFDMSSGTYLYDHTGNGNTGRLQNMGSSDWVPAGWGVDKTSAWTGSIDHDWTNPGNWDGVSVPPSSGENAIISPSSNNPRLETTVEIGGLYISSGASLTIAPTGKLTVDGLFSNTAGVCGLMIESTAAGTGSLISSTTSVSATVQRYIDGNSDWHLVSSPVGNATAQTFLGHYLQFFTETSADWTDIVSPSTTLTPAQGYSLWSGEETYTFQGNLNSGNISIATSQLYEDSVTDEYYGWNLVGNPYPSSIDWSQLDDTWGAVYYYTGTTYASWNNEAQTNGGTQYVAPGQGFFISSDGSNFQLSDAMRIHEGTSDYFKNTLANMLLLRVENQQGSDEVCIRLDAEANEGFDRTFDAWKILSGDENTGQLYTFSGNGILSIDARPPCEKIQLGFRSNQSGAYSFSLPEIHDIPTAIIEDTKTGKRHDLQNGNYHFEWNIGDDEQRFKLHLNAVGVEESAISESDIYIYAADGKIFIKNGAETRGRASVLTVSDVMGRVVYKDKISGSELTAIPVYLKTGVYIVSVKSGEEIKTEKVFIN